MTTNRAWKSHKDSKIVLTSGEKKDSSIVLDTNEKVIEYIKGLERVADGLFFSINDFEIDACKILGLRWDMATLGDIITCIRNLVDGENVFTGIDPEKIISENKGDNDAKD